MKWTEEQENLLSKLCFEEKSNAEIATVLGCDVKDIHAKRSQLGITIPKVKQILADKQPAEMGLGRPKKNQKATPEVKDAKASLTDPWLPIEAAFDQLDSSLLAASIMDHANAQSLRQAAAGVSVLKSLLLTAIQ